MAANRLFNGVKPKQVEGVFAMQNGMTGSPTASSPEVVPTQSLEEWAGKYRGLTPTKRQTDQRPSHKLKLECHYNLSDPNIILD